jgi:ATP-dependent Lon protease
MIGSIRFLQHTPPDNKLEFEALIASILDKSRQIIELSPNIPTEALVMLKNITNHSFLLNFIASNLGIKIKTKQEILEINALAEKANTIFKHMNSELQLLELRDKIENKVRGDIEKQQRDYFLNQQLKTIQEELGQNPQEEEIQKLLKKVKDKNWSDEVEKAFQKEIGRIKRMNPQVAEYSIQLSYLELFTDLPWNEYTKDNFNLKKVKAVLDKDHFGLEKVKERILEHLAVLKLKGDMKAPILCLVGPPGVGKTSLGKSIARALKREFVRMSLGGLHDESEVRGHRRTYIGAMPGRIIQSLKKTGSSNPVFILDEIDKVGKDFRGDPSSALLIATANSLNTIQPALLDRMEIIQVSGYSQEEKIEIAKKHLIPKQREEHGLKASEVKLGAKVIGAIVDEYTKESGVRSLNRQIAGVMRHVAKNVAMEQEYNISVKKEELKDILGPTKFSKDMYQVSPKPGVGIVRLH